VAIAQEPFWTRQQLTVWLPFYCQVLPTLMRFPSYVQKSASQKEISTDLHCRSALKGLEIPLRQSPTEPRLGLLVQGLQEQIHSYATADWLPPHLHRPLGTKGQKQLVSVFSQLSLICPLHTGNRLQN